MQRTPLLPRAPAPPAPAPARAFRQPCQRLSPEDPEPPRLRQMMIRREAGDRQQVEQRVARQRFAAELLVRPARGRDLAERHARRAETCTSAPTRRNSCE